MPNDTKGVDSGGFQSISTGELQGETTRGPQIFPPGGDSYGVRYFPQVINYLKENFLFTAILLSVTGYIIIASFGGMSSMGQYLGYLFFLLLVFAVYGLASRQNIATSSLLLLCLVLAAVIAYQNRNTIEAFSVGEMVRKGKSAPVITDKAATSTATSTVSH